MIIWCQRAKQEPRTGTRQKSALDAHCHLSGVKSGHAIGTASSTAQKDANEAEGPNMTTPRKPAAKKNSVARGKSPQASASAAGAARAQAKPKAASFSAAEKAAMRERAAEARAATKRRGSSGAAADAADVQAKIAALPEPDRALAASIHELIGKTAPNLAPRLWYGMPAYSLDGKVVCFVQPASKFKTRYLTLGFSDQATLDDGAMWPTVFAICVWNKTTQSAVRSLISKAVDR